MGELSAKATIRVMVHYPSNAILSVMWDGEPTDIAAISDEFEADDTLSRITYLFGLEKIGHDDATGMNYYKRRDLEAEKEDASVNS